MVKDNDFELYRFIPIYTSIIMLLCVSLGIIIDDINLIIYGIIVGFLIGLIALVWSVYTYLKKQEDEKREKRIAHAKEIMNNCIEPMIKMEISCGNDRDYDRIIHPDYHYSFDLIKISIDKSQVITEIPMFKYFKQHLNHSRYKELKNLLQSIETSIENYNSIYWKAMGLLRKRLIDDKELSVDFFEDVIFNCIYTAYKKSETPHLRLEYKYSEWRLSFVDFMYDAIIDISDEKLDIEKIKHYLKNLSEDEILIDFFKQLDRNKEEIAKDGKIIQLKRELLKLKDEIDEGKYLKGWCKKGQNEGYE